MPRIARPLQQLGRKSRLPACPADARLERVTNPHADCAYVARFTLPEFTTLCPITGQPDFAHLVIDYVPARWLVELKSMKLYWKLPKRWWFSRGLHRCDRQAPGGVVGAEISPHRRLLVSERRNAHRCFLANGQTAGRCLAARPERGALPRTWVARVPCYAPFARRSNAMSRRSKPSMSPRGTIFGRIRRRSVGILMCLNEYTGDTDRHRRARQYAHKLPFTAGGRAHSARLLDGMGCVKDDWRACGAGENR